MNRFSSLSDDYYVNMNVATEMELPCGRETVLHYFEHIQKKYPDMRNFYQREQGEFVLEEDKDRGHYRWCSIERQRVCSGCVNPETFEAAITQHGFLLDVMPYALSVSPIDCEAIDFLIGFDFTCRGNHNALIAEALGVNPAFESLAMMPGAKIINNEPTLTFSLDEDCRMQCRIVVESRTNAYQIRTGDYGEDQLSVYVTIRQYGGLGTYKNFAEALEGLSTICCDVVENYVADQVLEPLARTISLK